MSVSTYGDVARVVSKGLNQADLLNMCPGSIIRYDGTPNTLGQLQMLQHVALYQNSLQQQVALQPAQLSNEVLRMQLASMQNAYAPARPLPPYRESEACRIGISLGQRLVDRIVFWQGFLGPLADFFLMRFTKPLNALCEHIEARLIKYPA